MQKGPDLIRAAGLVQKLKGQGTTTPPDIYAAYISIFEYSIMHLKYFKQHFFSLLFIIHVILYIMYYPYTLILNMQSTKRLHGMFDKM